MTARDALDGMKAREPHVQCEDCGKCRLVEGEEWCLDCNYRSCERGSHCADAAPTDIARLIGAVEAIEAITNEMDETAALRAVNSDIKSYYATRIRAAVENALNPKEAQ